MGLGTALWQELVSGFPGAAQMASISVRLLVAIPRWAASLGCNEPTSAKPPECEPTCSYRSGPQLWCYCRC